MTHSILKSHIINSYDDLMQDYLQSPEVEYATSEWNKQYWSLWGKIDPELRQDLDDLLSALMQMGQTTAEEAMFRATIMAIAERDSLFK